MYVIGVVITRLIDFLFINAYVCIYMYMYLHTNIYIYVYIYIYTSLNQDFLCFFAFDVKFFLHKYTSLIPFICDG